MVVVTAAVTGVVGVAVAGAVVDVDVLLTVVCALVVPVLPLLLLLLR